MALKIIARTRTMPRMETSRAVFLLRRGLKDDISPSMPLSLPCFVVLVIFPRPTIVGEETFI
jgi:hypothetical protein